MRFKIGDISAYEYLEEHGFVVFSNVADNEELKELETLFWDMVTDRNIRIKEKDKTTWSNREWIGRLDVGTIPTCGQSAFMWRSRVISKQVFVSLYTYLSNNGLIDIEGVTSESKFISSFDGAGAIRDSSQIEWRGFQNWYHTDYDPIKNPDVTLYQGFLNIYDCDETTGGFCVIPGSHKFLLEHMKKTGRNKFDENEKLPSCFNSPIKVECKAGDFVLWNHSTFHCNTYASKNILRNRIERVVAYVCIIPLNLVNEKNREKLMKRRRLVAAYGCTTGHNPYTCIPYVYPDLYPDYADDLI